MTFDRGGGRRGGADLEWLTLGQAAKYLGVAQSTLRKWTDAEQVPAFKTPGGHRRYLRSDLDAFLTQSAGGASEPSGPLVLVVDDDNGLRSFVRTNLELEGFRVREASSAEAGLNVLEDELPDLLLLDVMMPKVDGWEMLQRIHERHGVDAIPVIMFSGKVEESQLVEATRRGARGFLGKGFDPQQLIERAKQILAT